jgi:hypothetical protein
MVWAEDSINKSSYTAETEIAAIILTSFEC